MCKIDEKFVSAYVYCTRGSLQAHEQHHCFIIYDKSKYALAQCQLISRTCTRQSGNELEPCLRSADGFDAVYPIEASQQGVWIVQAVLVVLGDEIYEQVHLLLPHGLDHEALIVGDEKDAARLSRRSQLPQCATQWSGIYV